MKLAGKKVLIADDEARLSEMLAISIRAEGAEVLTASDGAEAFRVATLENPDIMLMDLNMPGVNGLEAIRSLRMALNDKPILVLTGYSTKATFDSALEAGANECLSKPISAAALVEKMVRHLGGAAGKE